MAVLMFKERFAPLVESGEKRQTIRPPRKRPIKVGDSLSLRKWSGRAYASKQTILRDGEKCIAVRSVVMQTDRVTVDGWSQSMDWLDSFARADGFANYGDMLKWFNETHGLPFEGVLICW